MNTIDHETVLQKLTDRGIEITATPDGHLRLEPSDLLTDELRSLVRTNKAALISRLRDSEIVSKRELIASMWRLSLRSGGLVEKTFCPPVGEAQAIAETYDAVSGQVNQSCETCKYFCRPSPQGRPFCTVESLQTGHEKRRQLPTDGGSACQDFEGRDY